MSWGLRGSVGPEHCSAAGERAVAEVSGVVESVAEIVLPVGDGAAAVRDAVPGLARVYAVVYPVLLTSGD